MRKLTSIALSSLLVLAAAKPYLSGWNILTGGPAWADWFAQVNAETSYRPLS